MKIDWKIRKLWHFEDKFSQNISWPVDMNMQMSELMMSLPHYLPYILYINFWKIQYFAHTCDSMSLISSCIGVNIIGDIYSERNWGKSNIHIAEKWNFCHFCAQNEWEIVRRWHHQLAHLHIHTNWSRNVTWKFAKLQSVITFLFFNRFSSGFHCFYSQIFTLSYEIKLNLFRISPLTMFIIKNLSCMAHHVISVFDKVLKWSPENCTSKALLSASKMWKKRSDWMYQYSFSTIDCCVRINHQSDSLWNCDIHYSVIDILIVTA